MARDLNVLRGSMRNIFVEELELKAYNKSKTHGITVASRIKR
jgi:hypothetical protein